MSGGQPDGLTVEASGLRLKFPGSAGLLFDDLSVAVPAGQRVLLLGPSGCGKSTLLQVLAGLIPRVIDTPMKAERLVVPAAPGYLFQDPDTQFCMPFVDEELAFVLENLSVPRERMPALIREALALTGLELADPHTPIASLSQGMKQRLGIASLLLLQPDVWFLDEPTSLLDPEGTKHVWETIRAVTSGKTVLIVEHKIEEVVAFVDRVLLFDGEARLLADGTPDDVFSRFQEQLRAYGIWYPGVWEDYAGRRGLPAKGDAAQPDSVSSAAAPVLRLSDFQAYYGRTAKLHVASAEVQAGDWVAIVGENGAGKSTLLQALMQLLPTSGSYALLGKTVRGFADVRESAAYVFQNPELQFIANTVYDELAFNLRSQGMGEARIAEEMEKLLGRFGLTAHQGHHPYQLSLGQKRRLSVAAATAGSDARLLLLDEPTFGQDAANTFALLELLASWRRKGAAVVMVTHDPEIVRYFATTVWEVHQGRLAGTLTPEAYLRRFGAAANEPVGEATACR